MFRPHSLRRAIPGVTTSRSRTRLLLLGVLVGVASCQDSPTNVPTTDRLGQLIVPAGQGAVLLSLAPASSVDSIRIGTSDGHYRTSSVRAGRVVLYSADSTALPPLLRFRVFGRDASVSTLTITPEQTASLAGSVGTGAGVQVLFDR